MAFHVMVGFIDTPVVMGIFIIGQSGMVVADSVVKLIAVHPVDSPAVLLA